MCWSGALEYNYRLLNTGGAGAGQPNPNAFADYATATSTPANREVLLAYKCNETDQWTWPGSAIFYYNNYSNYWTNNRYDTDMSGLLSNFLELYYDEKGDDIDWPKVGDSAPRDASDWLEKINGIEPRAKADNIFIGFDAFNNPGNSNWTANSWGRQTGNAAKTGDSPRCSARTRVARLRPSSTIMRARASGSSSRCSAWPKSTSIWPKPTTSMETPPRHSKTSIWCTTVPVWPAVTETDRDALREIIHRERAVEFYRENLRYYDVKHWKDENIDKGIIGGDMRELQFKVKADASGSLNLPEGLESYWNAVTYTSYWNPRMYLEPLPQSEINKGTLVQNPGY